MSKKAVVILSFVIFLAGILAGFLILKQLVLSTTIPNHEAMQMSEPRPERDSEKIKTNTPGAVTLLLSANNNIYYYTGSFNGVINKTDFNYVGELIRKYNAEINKNDLMFIIKSEQAATFKNAIDILDQMTLNNVPPGHYTETEITNEEIESIKKFKEK